jgi:predicted PurR-regulated permease PerM
MLYAQITAIINVMPDYIDRVREYFLPWTQQWINDIFPNYSQHIEEAASQTSGKVASFVGSAVKKIISGGLALVDIITIFILMPITAFYVLRDWDKMTNIIDSLIPRKSYVIIKEQLSEINRTLSGFIRGQALVCLCLGLFYAIGLVLAGLQYGATVGLVSGILSIIPYVGTIFGFVVSTVLALVQFEGDMLRTGLVILVFMIGQGLEGYVLTPKLVGDRVGLHPMWILFAIIAGINLLGFTGALIAVPVAAVIGVLIRFAVKMYKNSNIYKKLV